MSSLVVSEAAMQNAERNIRKELPMVSGTWAQGSSLAGTLAGQRDGIAAPQIVHGFMQHACTPGSWHTWASASRLMPGERLAAAHMLPAVQCTCMMHLPLQRSVFTCNVAHA